MSSNASGINSKVWSFCSVLKDEPAEKLLERIRAEKEKSKPEKKEKIRKKNEHEAFTNTKQHSRVFNLHLTGKRKQHRSNGAG